MAVVHFLRTHQETHKDALTNLQPTVKIVRSSPEALQVLTQLRQRVDSVSQQHEVVNQEPSDSNFEAVARAASLLPGMANDFEVNPKGFLAHFPESAGMSEARVTIPAHANEAFELQDVGTGMQVQAMLQGAQHRPAEMADGYAVYRQALRPDTALLRRALPNGTEDFVSFAQAPRDPSVTYQVTLDANVAGLRNVDNMVELLDSNGTPRLRVDPPYLVSADGSWVEAQLTLNGCTADTSAAAPWGRNVAPPGAQACQLRVSWDNGAVEYPALLDPTWVTTSSMTTARQGHTATLLSTNKVLVVGGTNGNTTLASAELYDRTTGTWAATGSMINARQWHTAVQLNTSSNPTTSGKVLVAGGRNGSTSLYTAELYSPSAGTWMAAANLNANAPREQHTATVLTSGKVLVIGGVSGSTVLATAATYDPSSGVGTWTGTTGPMPGARKFHTATLITTSNTQLNGKVLVVGGNSGTASQPSVYLYDPAQLAFSTLTPLTTPREGHTATVLSNSKVLFAGGKNGTTTLNTAIVYDPSTGAGNWSAVGNMTAARQAHSASRLSNGQVLVAGGSNGTNTLSSAELFNGTNSWATTTVMPAPVQAHTATLLGNSMVLIAGGLNVATVQSAAQLYDVTGGNSCTSNSQCLSGNCVSGVCCNTACADQCYSCSLTGLVGICSPKANGTTCNDGNACTQTDTCQSGACTGSNPVTCTALDQCHAVGTCNPSNGVCSNPNQPDGTACNDNNACTRTDTCQSGACTGSNPVTCTALDQCHAVGTCNPSNGVCSNPNQPDGTACNDSNVCTQTDTCVSGACTGSNPVTCTAADACHLPGTCDAITGCSNPVAPDGTACSDNNACTAPDQCASGSCQSGAAVPVDDGDPCTVDSCDAVLGVVHTPDTSNPNCAKWYSGGLQLQVQTAACSANQVQQLFQVTNKGTTPVSLSDIAIRFWVDDTSGTAVGPQVISGGSAVIASNNHVVTGVSSTATSLSSACGPDANHQANWEIAITNSDSAQLNTGETWTNLQVQVQLAGSGSFSPGTSSWYSPCLSGNQYATDNHFAVYYKGNFVFSSGINAPACSALSAACRPALRPFRASYETPAAPVIGPAPGDMVINLTVGLPLRDF